MVSSLRWRIKTPRVGRDSLVVFLLVPVPHLMQSENGIFCSPRWLLLVVTMSIHTTVFARMHLLILVSLVVLILVLLLKSLLPLRLLTDPTELRLLLVRTLLLMLPWVLPKLLLVMLLPKSWKSCMFQQFLLLLQKLQSSMTCMVCSKHVLPVGRVRSLLLYATVKCSSTAPLSILPSSRILEMAIMLFSKLLVLIIRLLAIEHLYWYVTLLVRLTWKPLRCIIFATLTIWASVPSWKNPVPTSITPESWTSLLRVCVIPKHFSASPAKTVTPRILIWS
mmetsp:Transcript_60671/g.67862  ORF Transcript_60671/g.67862 Transcript_60671/m.67862 type:complete len:279 (+) Transcript_60671:1018-1854(+)